MTLQEWNAMQIAEALSDVNRYFFWQKNNRDPFDNDELVLFYILNGGARHYRDNHKQESEAQNEQETRKTHQQAPQT